MDTAKGQAWSLTRNPRHARIVSVHAVDAHSNKSALVPPAAGELAGLAQKARMMEPRTALDSRKPVARSLRRRLAPGVREAIVSRYEAGESALALSQEYGISRDGVRRLLKSAGVTIRTQSVITPKVTQQIVRLYENGLTIRQVAAQVGCAYGTVRRCCTRTILKCEYPRSGDGLR
jgi:DNA invertase Pin-like site-specific DNA recombinase